MMTVSDLDQTDEDRPTECPLCGEIYLGLVEVLEDGTKLIECWNCGLWFKEYISPRWSEREPDHKRGIPHAPLLRS